MPYDVSHQKGGCACGAVRYEIAEAETLVSAFCFCRNCQISGGTEGAPIFSVPKAAVEIIGEAKSRDYTSDRGTHMHAYFCEKCGSRVYGLCDEMPDLVIFRVGTLKNPEIFKPELYMYTDKAPSWFIFDENIPQFKGMPPLPGEAH